MREHFYDKDSQQINMVFIYPIHTAVQKTKAVRTISLKEARTFHSGQHVEPPLDSYTLKEHKCR